MSDFLRKVNEVWSLHDLEWYELERTEDAVDCIAFVVDDRYIEADDDPDVQIRQAVSFGDNVFPDTRPQGVLTPPPAAGKFLFGLHLIGIRGKRIAVFDQWTDDRQAGDCKTAEDGERRAREILAAMADEDYARHLVGNPRQDPLTPLRRAPVDLTGFEPIENESHL